MAPAFRLDRRAFIACAACAAAGTGFAAAGTRFAAADTTQVTAQITARDPLKLEKLADGVFVYAAPYELMAPENGGAICNMGLVVGTESAAVIDTGNSVLTGRRLKEAVRRVTDRPVRFVINTHMHPDHVLGNAAFRGEGTSFVAHRKMPRALAVRTDTYMAQVHRLLGPLGDGTEVVLPDVLVDGRMSLDLGGRALILESWPTAHTDNDLTVFDEASGTWFLGDLLFVGHVPTLDGSLKGWLALMEALTARGTTRVVPGHGPASVAWPVAAGDERRYLDLVQSDVRRLIAEGRPMSVAPDRVAQSERERWVLFDEFNPRNAIAAYHEYEWE
jgi:quinoprotein relay system zinc metallohydrolase 2